MRKEYKDAEGATIMTVVWSSHSFQLLTWADLSWKERKEFDWLDTPEKREAEEFVRYRNWPYAVSEFMSFGGSKPWYFAKWHGYHSDSAFSGTLIWLLGDGRAHMGTYFN